MNLIRTLVLSLLLGPTFGFAQLLQLTGEVNAVEGAFVGVFQKTDAFRIALDVRLPLPEQIPPVMTPGRADYLVPLDVSVRGVSLSSPSAKALLTVFWGANGEPQPYHFDGMIVNFGNIGNPFAGGVGLLTEEDVITSKGLLPPGIPMSTFAAPFFNGEFHRLGTLPYGYLGFTITGYHYVSPFTAVPEPGTYTSLAALLLVVFVVYRHRTKAKGSRRFVEA
jgi:hypothetical protein